MPTDEPQEPWKPGDEPTAERMTRWAESLELQRIETVGDLNVTHGGQRPILSRQKREPIVAKLSGASSPYSWTSQVNSIAGIFASGPRSGTSNAYEVNGRSGLADKVVRLYPDGRGKYNFQAKSCCSSSPPCTGTVTVNVKCGGSNLSGVTVSLTLAATTVTATTNASGNATFALTTAGTWSGTATRAGYTTQSFSVVFVCANQTVNVVMAFASYTITGIVGGPCGNSPSQLVTFIQNGSTIGTATTNAIGAFSATLSNDGSAITITVVRSRYNSYSFTFTPAACTGSFFKSIVLTMASGYHCDSACVYIDPIPDTIYCTVCDGTYALNYDSGSGTWIGAGTATMNVQPDCAETNPSNCAPRVQTITLPIKIVYGASKLAVYSYAYCEGAVGGSPDVCGNWCSGTVDEGWAMANPGCVQLDNELAADAFCTFVTHNPLYGSFPGILVYDVLGNLVFTGATITE